MTATKPAAPGELSGMDALLAGQRMSQTPRGGMEFGFRGESGSTGDTKHAPGTPGQPQDFTGAGPWLEQSDKQVYESMHGLILRQELLALNHLAQDTHWTFVKLGYPWSTLTKIPGKDTYQQSLPYGAAGIQIQAVPNKVWDLVKKTKESLLVDFPESDAEPLDDSEDAETACDMANRFLSQDAGEQGTNDAVLFGDRVERALTCATTYLECWTDPTGGGYVPLQILAHPLAQSPQNPLVGPDGMPTTDHVLRYVTADNQFTDDASQATPQWRPKLRASRWNREHVRVFPETATIDNAEKVLIIGYCTVAEAKRRWKDVVGAMTPDELSQLCNWTPLRYLALLPPFLRARWKLTDGRDKEKQGSSDERILFYYHGFAKACPDYTKGADVVVSGAFGGRILSKTLLAKPVTVKKGQGTTQEVRCFEIPVVAVTPFGDPDDQDPTGRCYVELFAGAAENTAHLAMSYSEAIDQALHNPWTIPSTSPIEGYQVEEARASGDFLLLAQQGDKPTQLDPPQITESFVNMYRIADDATNSIATQNKPAQGSDTQQEVSGKARQIAIAQNNVGLTGPQTAVNNAYARWCRIKIERAMSDFTTEQQVDYVGEDGAYKQDTWTGIDFALVGKVTIKAGTGTMMTPDKKVEYLGSLVAQQMMPAAEAADAARSSFSKRLGIAPDPHEQHVERSLESWLKGPPSPEWEQQWQQYSQQKAQYDQAQQQFQQASQLWQQGQQMQAIANGGPPQPLGPEQQNEQAMVQYQQATLWLQSNPLPPTPPVPPQIPAPVAPWHPFQPRPNDQEPAIAAIWQRKLSRTMSSVKWSQFNGTGWQQVFNDAYQRASQVLQQMQQLQQQSPPRQRAA